MPPRQAGLVDVQFLSGERYAYGITPYRRLEAEIPAKPGLYSWHFRFPQRDPAPASAFLHQLFVSSTLQISANSNMRQTWEGKLHSTIEPFGELENESLRHFFFALAYPIYIGISRDLSRRLATHKKELNAWRVADEPNFQMMEPPAEFEDDSAEESRTFGRRLGAIFRESGFTDTDCLYVKYYSPAHCAAAANCRQSAQCLQDTMTELREAERTCNTLFHPALGRR
jgi:hypothetical protein